MTMDVSSLHLPWIVPIALVAALVILLYWYGSQPFGLWKSLGVHGPQPHAFVGNIPEMFDDRIGIRVSIGRWQKEYGRIFGIYFFRTPTLIVTDPEVLKQLFVKEFVNFSDRYFVGDSYLNPDVINKGLFFTTNVDWKRIRQIMSPTFSSGKLKQLTHYVNLNAQRLGQNLRHFAEIGQKAEAKMVFGAYTLDVICGTAFGLDTNSQQKFEGPFIEHVKSMLTFTKSLQLLLGLAGVFPTVAPLLKKLRMGVFKHVDTEFFKTSLTNLVRERKLEGVTVKHTDFLQLLLDAEAVDSDSIIGDKKLSTEEIVAQGLIFIIAGYETTSTTLQFLAYELGKNQEIQNKIREEIFKIVGKNAEPDYDVCQNLKYTEAAIKETLRLYPPLHVINRLTAQATTFNGVPVPAGSAVMVPIGNIGRDPEFFTDPDTFDPARFLNENKNAKNDFLFLPFGQGPRICLGMRLALMEMKIALVHMLRNVRIVDALPDVLDIEDYTMILIPRKPIQLVMQTLT